MASKYRIVKSTITGVYKLQEHHNHTFGSYWGDKIHGSLELLRIRKDALEYADKVHDPNNWEVVE